MRTVLSLWKGEMLVPSNFTWKDTAKEVAAKHGLTLEDLRGPRRFRQVAHARQEAWAMIRERHELSYPRIGQLFGDRDHCTVWKGVRAHEKRVASQ